MWKQTSCNKAGNDVCNVCCIVTLSESKQAMTRPFSTWQLREGCANLHSTSDREQVPLWNSRHTSKVSHLVSRPMVMLTAIWEACKHWAVWWGQMLGKNARWEWGWLRVIQAKIPQHHTEETEANFFSLSLNSQSVLLVGVFWGMFVSSSWEKWQLKFTGWDSGG